MLRHPKTAQEARAASDPEVEPLIRPSRRAKNLPTSYNDIVVKVGGRKPRYKDHRK